MAWRLPVSFREQHFDTAIHQVLIDVANGMGLLDDQFLYFDAVRYFLRRLPSAGENDLRPVGLDLRGGLAGELGVELVPRRRTFCLVDREGLFPIGEMTHSAQENIHDLVFTEFSQRAPG